MTDKFSRRMWIWRHNGFLGSVRMAETSIGNMARAGSLTPEAAMLAESIRLDLMQLKALLKTRIDPPKES